jgi:hypothetical protein
MKKGRREEEGEGYLCFSGSWQSKQLQEEGARLASKRGRSYPEAATKGQSHAFLPSIHFERVGMSLQSEGSAAIDWVGDAISSRLYFTLLLGSP